MSTESIFSSFTIALPSVDLPEPRSPTQATVSPYFTSRLTLFKACVFKESKNK